MMKGGHRIETLRQLVMRGSWLEAGMLGLICGIIGCEEIEG